MMHQELHAAYLDAGDFQLLTMPYKGNEVSMVVVLPKKGDGLSEVEKKLSATSLQQELAKAKVANLAFACRNSR